MKNGGLQKVWFIKSKRDKKRKRKINNRFINNKIRLKTNGTKENEINNKQIKKCYIKCKRMADILLSGMALFFLSPVLLGISIAIKLDSKGPVIFCQTRVGIHKSHFEIYKFRTMYADTPKDMPTHLLQNPDAMVTKTGAFLRKYSLDELPQLVNILRGDMSIVGPRPALWNQYDLVEERDKYGANDVMPGLTGWAQINGRDELEIPVKAKLDGEYVRRFGFWMDIRCIIGTVFAVAGHKGVVEGGTGTMQEQSGSSGNGAGSSNRTGSSGNGAGSMVPGLASGAAAARMICEQQKETLSAEPKRVLVTGAGSYIGTAVRKWLSAFGGHYEVEELNMHGDLWKDYDFSKYDTIFHVAGIAHADTGGVSKEQKQLYYEVNRDLAVQTAKKAKASGVKQFIYMSSMIIYGESIRPFQGRFRITAMTRPQPANFYGNSKWQGDRGVRELETPDFKVCVLRPPMIYGTGSKGNYRMLAKLAVKAPVFPLVYNERSVLHIDHLCEFVRLMIENEEAGVFFPQDAAYADTCSLVALVAKAHGKKIRLWKTLAPGVRLASKVPGRIGRLADKAFGSFSYEMSLSEYPKGDYRLHNLEQSIFVTENESPDAQESG